MLSKEHVLKVLKIYANAWTNQNPDLILTIFTPDAIYQEWAFEKPHVGHLGIKKYWQEKVVEEQSKITFKLLDLYIDNERHTAIAEWEATFHINNSAQKTVMKEVAILEFKGNKIKYLREYWANIEK